MPGGFVEDEVLRERLKEAKGIGTPATRAEIIGGLKRQDFLVAQGKNIVPTETGLKLFGVLKQADPALVDPGVTAQLECLLDDVVVGKQEMVGAIDAVCDVAQRIIGKLKDGAAAGGLPSFAPAAGNGAATSADACDEALCRQPRPAEGHQAAAGYKTSISICRKFLSEHAPKKADGETAGSMTETGQPGPVAVRQEDRAGKGLIIPDEAKASSAAMSAWIDSNRGTKRRRRGRDRLQAGGLSASRSAGRQRVTETQSRRR